jgi:formyl-CoA transferase
MLADPQFVAREAIVKVAHPQFGELRMQNVAPKLSETPGGIRSPSPALGQHNEEVYQRLMRFTPERVETLRRQGVI